MGTVNKRSRRDAAQAIAPPSSSDTLTKDIAKMPRTVKDTVEMLVRAANFVG